MFYVVLFSLLLSSPESKYYPSNSYASMIEEMFVKHQLTRARVDMDGGPGRQLLMFKSGHPSKGSGKMFRFLAKSDSKAQYSDALDSRRQNKSGNMTQDSVAKATTVTGSVLGSHKATHAIKRNTRDGSVRLDKGLILLMSIIFLVVVRARLEA